MLSINSPQAMLLARPLNSPLSSLFRVLTHKGHTNVWEAGEFHILKECIWILVKFLFNNK
jgi:hypothetical protein